MVFVLVLFTGYLYFNYRDHEIISAGDDEVKIPFRDNITKINIEIGPDTGHMDDYEISDKEEIGAVVNSLNSIYAVNWEAGCNAKVENTVVFGRNI